MRITSDRLSAGLARFTASPNCSHVLSSMRILRNGVPSGGMVSASLSVTAYPLIWFDCGPSMPYSLNMSNAETTPETVKCRRCKRALTSASSIAARVGPRCAAIEAATEGLNAGQAEKAIELVADGGVAKVRDGVYRVCSGDGESAYLTALTGQCSCAWGLKRTSAAKKACAHVAAAILKARPVARRSLAKAA
jgi:Family of unknown function (DUF6011)